ncbi:MAG: N-acetylneuraminate synthase [Firmicutes bacterium]|nr:N-acetylneuraminate synthase [Bacillota bacterium]MCM1401683.1 N-acetylneuraminate synthase [Bacteroides sp.]MCM1477540.1 N-acetylneuraminate synthase [Bacteroides sp.]
MSNHTIIIAEAGVNHGGDIEQARELVKAAAAAGADYVKFQTFKAENLVCQSAQRAEYQKRNCGGNETQLQMLKRLELKASHFGELSELCRKLGIGFLSSPFDVESVELLAPLKMDYWKIPSGEITNLPLLEAIGRQGGKIILSTGMSTIDEVEQALRILEESGTKRSNVILLHCNTQYPTEAADVNLLAMTALGKLSCAGVGFSDHTVGTAAPIAAVALGAMVIEKHFTLDKNMPGPDHKASADPNEFASMVRDIRFVEQALGSPLKHVTDSEKTNVEIARKSIVAKIPIAKGEKFTTLNLTTKRPATGLSPMMWHYVIGQIATRDFAADEPITL